MKSAISSTTTLLSSKNLSHKLHLNHSPFSRLPSSFFGSNSNTHFASLLIRNNSFHNQKSQIHTPIMASSFKPEQARAPPALPLPVPPVTKARFFLFTYFCNWFFGFLAGCGMRCDVMCSLRLGCVSYRWRLIKRGILRTLAKQLKRLLQVAPSLSCCL